MYATEKTDRAPIVESTTLKKIVGEISGTVTLRNRCHALAPSILAASISSEGTAWSPARKTTIRLPPAVFHNDRMTSDGNAQAVLWTHGGPGIRTRLNRKFSTPIDGCRIHSQMSTEAMMGVIDGRKKKVRNNVVPLKPLVSSSAAPSEAVTPSGTTRRAYCAVLPRDSQKRLSPLKA